MAQYFFTDAGAPTTTPAVKGAIYVDTTAGRGYLSIGTSSSADWFLIPKNSSEIIVDADIDFGGNYKAINLKGLDFQTFTEYTIASGVIAPVQSLASIDTEGDASADDIDTITVATDLNMIGLKMENSARVPTLKHGTGNLSLPNGADVVMVNDVIYWLVYDGSNWLLAFDPAGVALTFPVSDATTLLKGSIDDTKKARLEVDTNTPTATTIVISTPSTDFDMDESVRNSTTATTNALPRYSGSGKYIKDSGVLIDDSENLSGVAKISTSDHVELTEIAAPSTPASGKVAVYTKTDGKLYIKDDAGTETDLTSGGGGGASGILPTAESSKTADYTILSGDVGTRLELGSGTAADRTFTLDVSLFSDSTEQISFINKSAYKLTIVVSNTGTMTINDNRTDLPLWLGDGVLAINGDTSTNANTVAGY